MISAEELALLGGSDDAIVAVDDENRIQFASRAALDLLKWDEGLIGQPLTVIIPSRLREVHLRGFRRYVQTGVSRLQGSTVRVPALRGDHTEQEIDLTIRVFRRPDGTNLVAAAFSVAALGHAPPGLRVLEESLLRRLYELI